MTQTGALGRILMVKRMELRFVLKDLKIVIMYSTKCHSKPVCYYLSVEDKSRHF